MKTKCTEGRVVNVGVTKIDIPGSSVVKNRSKKIKIKRKLFDCDTPVLSHRNSPITPKKLSLIQHHCVEAFGRDSSLNMNDQLSMKKSGKINYTLIKKPDLKQCTGDSCEFEANISKRTDGEKIAKEIKNKKGKKDTKKEPLLDGTDIKLQNQTLSSAHKKRLKKDKKRESMLEGRSRDVNFVNTKLSSASKKKTINNRKRETISEKIDLGFVIEKLLSSRKKKQRNNRNKESTLGRTDKNILFKPLEQVESQLSTSVTKPQTENDNKCGHSPLRNENKRTRARKLRKKLDYIINTPTIVKQNQDSLNVEYNRRKEESDRSDMKEHVVRKEEINVSSVAVPCRETECGHVQKSKRKRKFNSGQEKRLMSSPFCPEHFSNSYDSSLSDLHTECKNKKISRAPYNLCPPERAPPAHTPSSTCHCALSPDEGWLCVYSCRCLECTGAENRKLKRRTMSEATCCPSSTSHNRSHACADRCYQGDCKRERDIVNETKGEKLLCHYLNSTLSNEKSSKKCCVRTQSICCDAGSRNDIVAATVNTDTDDRMKISVEQDTSKPISKQRENPELENSGVMRFASANTDNVSGLVNTPLNTFDLLAPPTKSSTESVHHENRKNPCTNTSAYDERCLKGINKLEPNRCDASIQTESWSTTDSTGGHKEANSTLKLSPCDQVQKDWSGKPNVFNEKIWPSFVESDSVDSLHLRCTEPTSWKSNQLQAVLFMKYNFEQDYERECRKNVEFAQIMTRQNPFMRKRIGIWLKRSMDELKERLEKEFQNFIDSTLV